MLEKDMALDPNDDGALLAPLDEEDDEDESILAPGKKAQLVAETIATAVRNRHPLDLHWSVAAPVQRRRPKGRRR